MKNLNQIEILISFLKSNDENLIINEVNNELGIFYLSLIKYYSDKQGINIDIDHSTESLMSEGDLFGMKKIKIYNLISTKKIFTVLNTNDKKIIFTDYKNYKKLNSKYVCINGYKFEYDINFFIKHELKIDNDDLLNYCKNNPVLLFSEISKYLINKDQYSSDSTLVEEKNHILSIRKSMFENKKNNFNIKKLYLNIKKEAAYKKLSFLTY